MSKPTNFVDHLIFQASTPAHIPWLRMGFAVLAIINTLVWLRDGSYWFSDAGVLSTTSALEMNNHARWSLLFYLPSTPLVINTCLTLLLLHCILLLVGCWSRLQMLCIFVWIVSFQIRNPIICDGEDTLFRCFAFFMIFLPLDCGWSVTRAWRARRGQSLPIVSDADTWAVSLMQFQMTVIYVSATWMKLHGTTWQDGTALYIVSHMTDHFGRLPAATGLFDQLWAVKAITWSVVVIEGMLPILLWIPRTRRFGVALGITLHLGIELTMHLFLFEWLMILGLAAFLGRSRKRAPVGINEVAANHNPMRQRGEVPSTLP